MAEKKLKYKGPIQHYMRWPMYSLIILVGVDIWLFFEKYDVGLILAILTVVYGAIVFLSYNYQKKHVVDELVNFANNFSATQSKMLDKMNIPYGIIHKDQFLWGNKMFHEITNYIFINGVSIKNKNQELSNSILNIIDKKSENEYFNFNGKCYKIQMIKNMGKSNFSSFMKNRIADDIDEYYGICFFDETELRKYKKESIDKSLVCGLIYVDNFDEIMETVDELDQSYVTALIDRKITGYIREYDGLAKKMENDKYFVVFRLKAFRKMKEEGFSIVKSIRKLEEEVAEFNVIPTVSIGIGAGGDTYEDCYKYSRAAVEMAISRGGDQVVYKDKTDIEYYGGKTEKEGKYNRVKARVKAEALRDLLITKESIFVMGHKLTDVDSLGAAVGIARIAQAFGKKVKIVIDMDSASIKPLIEKFEKDTAYDDSIFIDGSKALSIASSKSLAIVVDTNRSSMVECENLLTVCKSLVVIDHHRQTKDSIKNATITYIESYASSASEMVTELIRYISDEIKLTGVEADCMYAGIMIDTNNFLTKTGIRTFEAAAYLRRNGADVSRVRKIFRDDIVAFRAKADAIRMAEVYKEHYMITTFFNTHVSNPTVIGAQVANALLSIDKIKATFVFTNYKGKIYISARSIDEANVQRIMENMGGGGHMTIAGAQLSGSNMEEGIDKLKEILDTMIEKGDL